MDKLIKELEIKREKYRRIEKELSSPALLSEREKYRKKAKEYSDLKSIVEEYEKLEKLIKEKKNLLKLLDDPDTEEEYLKMAEEELEQVKGRIEKKTRSVEDMLLDGEMPDYGKNVIMEIRAGTGGLEASLFASDLFRMYSKFSEGKNWNIQVLSNNFSEAGGIKEVILSVEGKDVFKYLQFEMGTHRVQRVPETETSGRIHTSAATVAVLPEIDEVEDIDIKTQDLKIDVYRSSGAGGQHVNVTDSAVRITHLPTNVVVSCQDERSQHKNKAKALRILKARIYEEMKKRKHKERAQVRKKQVGSGDRSEKIRTYNFPENRVTDHRINLTIYDLSNIMEGALSPVIEPLLKADRELKLRS